MRLNPKIIPYKKRNIIRRTKNLLYDIVGLKSKYVARKTAWRQTDCSIIMLLDISRIQIGKVFYLKSFHRHKRFYSENLHKLSWIVFNFSHLRFHLWKPARFLIFYIYKISIGRQQSSTATIGIWYVCTHPTFSSHLPELQHDAYHLSELFC